MSINRHTKGRTGSSALDLPGLSLRTLRIGLAATAASGVEVDTGKKIPAKSVVLGVYVDMATGASSITPLMDIGTLSTASGGDADGLLIGLLVDTVGVKAGSMVASARTVGALGFVGTAASMLFAQPPLIDISRNVSFTARAPISAMQGEIVILLGSL